MGHLQVPTQRITVKTCGADGQAHSSRIWRWTTRGGNGNHLMRKPKTMEGSLNRASGRLKKLSKLAVEPALSVLA